MKNLILAALLLAGATGAQAQNMPDDPYGDATVGRAEAEASAGERFSAIDTDKDGAISAEERAAGGDGPRRPGGGAGRADVNGDGKLTRDEYIASQLSRFDRQDANHDGQLTRAERDESRARMMERMREGGWGGGGGSGD